MKNKPYLSNTPPIREMTTHMIDSWQHLSKLENRIICLENGLDIYPSGRFGIDYDNSAKYDAKYEYEKLMVRVFEVQSKIEFILSNQLRDLVHSPSVQAILELSPEKQVKIREVFVKIVAKKLAEHANKNNTSEGEG